MLNRQFETAVKHTKWATDVIEFHVGHLQGYVSPVLDLHDNRIDPWSESSAKAKRPALAVKDITIQLAENHKALPQVRGQALGDGVVSQD